MTGRTLTQRGFAAVCRTNEHTIRQLVKQGVVSRPARPGQYTDEHIGEYIDHLVATLPKQSPTPELTDIRTRLARVKLAAAEREEAITERQYAPIALFEEMIAKAGAVIQSVLETIPGQFKKRVPHLRASELDILRKLLNRAATALSDADINAPIEPNPK
jgi:terminase small subunit / prophage DNA-packing protein